MKVSMKMYMKKIIITIVGVVVLNIYLMGLEAFSDLKLTGEEMSKVFSFESLMTGNINDTLPHWLLDYAKFHRRMLLNPPSDCKYLVWYCSGQCGGIGDRLKGIVMALYVALATNRVLLIHSDHPLPLIHSLTPAYIDWYSKAERAYYLHLFSGGFDVHGVFSRGANQVYEDILLSNFNFSHARKIIVLHSNLIDWESPLNYEPFRQSLETRGIPAGKWDIDSRNLLFRWAFPFLFNLSSDLKTTIQLKKKRLGLSPSKEFLAAHIRHGGSWGDAIRHESTGPFIACAKNMLKVYTGSPIFYVASDSNVSKAEFVNAVPHALADFEGDITHMDKLGSDSTNLVQGTLNAWADFILLSEAKCLVVSSSGFSILASMLLRDPVSGKGCMAYERDCSIESIEKSMMPLNYPNKPKNLV